MSKRGFFLLPLLAGALALGACDDGDSPTADGMGRVSVQLTDAPGDFQAAFVEIEKVYLQRVPGEEDPSGSRVYLLESPTGYIDLLTLAGGRFDEIAEATVPAGSYGQLRFVIGDAYVVLKNGDVYATRGAELPAGMAADGELKCPSCAQSGLKVRFVGGPLTVDEGTNVVRVDFDVNQSFQGHEAGRSGKFILKPVMLATVDFAAGIRGNVALQNVTLPLACGGLSLAQDSLLTRFVPTATAGDVMLTGYTQPDGTFTIASAAPGGYTLGYLPAIAFANGDTLSFAAAVTPASATVESGRNVTGVQYTVSAASCKVAAKPAS